jgi:hypothetical protein
VCIFISFYPHSCTDCFRRIRCNYLDELGHRYPQAAQLIKSNLDRDDPLQERIARIILSGSPYWHKNEEGEINLNAVKTLVALGECVSRGDDRAEEILSAVEYLLDSYYLDEILARIANGDESERRGALAELLNLAYIKKNGVTIDGQHYQAHILSCSVSFTRKVTLGKKQFDGLIILTNSNTGEKRYVLISSKNKNGLNDQSIKGLKGSFGKDLRKVLKLHPRVNIVDPPLLKEDEFSTVGVLFLLSTYKASQSSIERALAILNDWAKEELTPEQRKRFVGISYCPIPASLITYIEGTFFPVVNSLSI